MRTWATCPKGSIGALLASSFSERINSCTNQVVTLGNTLLGDCEMEKLMTCRLNRDFIVFMRAHYSHVAVSIFFLKFSRFQPPAASRGDHTLPRLECSLFTFRVPTTLHSGNKLPVFLFPHEFG